MPPRPTRPASDHRRAFPARPATHRRVDPVPPQEYRSGRRTRQGPPMRARNATRVPSRRCSRQVARDDHGAVAEMLTPSMPTRSTSPKLWSQFSSSPYPAGDAGNVAFPIALAHFCGRALTGDGGSAVRVKGAIVKPDVSHLVGAGSMQEIANALAALAVDEATVPICASMIAKPVSCQRHLRCRPSCIGTATLAQALRNGRPCRPTSRGS
jgi:hypothetical protein